MARAIDVLDDRWTLLILRNATLGIKRFEDLRARPGIADNILFARLVDAGVLIRVPYRDRRRTRHEYRLATADADVLGVLHALARWVRSTPRPASRPNPMRVGLTALRTAAASVSVRPHRSGPVREDASTTSHVGPSQSRSVPPEHLSGR